MRMKKIMQSKWRKVDKFRQKFTVNHICKQKLKKKIKRKWKEMDEQCREKLH